MRLPHQFSTILIGAATAALVLSAGPAPGSPIDGRFNYQGRLTSAGVPVIGLADLTFSLWDADAAGAQIGADVALLNVPVSDGLFIVELDFGVAALSGEQRWLEIEVRSPAGVGGYSTLGRQEILGTPYAIQTRGLFVDNAFNVGIGTTSPLADLHLGGASPYMLIKDDATNVGVELASIDQGGIWRTLAISTDLFGTIGTEIVQTDTIAQQVFYNNSTGARTALLGNDGASLTGVVALGGLNHSSTALLYGDGDLDANNGVDVGMLSLRSFGGGSGGEVSIRNDSNSETFELLGGATGNGGTLSLFNPANGNATVSIMGDDAGLGGRIETFSEDGFDQARIEPDSHGQGVFLVLNRLDTNAGLIFDGNDLGTGDSKLIVTGASRSVNIQTRLAGSSSVSLPTDAVEALEILDEPGVGSAIRTSTLSLTGAVDTILSRTITAPTSGYCVVIGTCQVFINHSNGTTSTANFGVSDTSSSLPLNQDVALQLSNNTPSGGYVLPVTVHGTFSVGAGSNTFYLLGDENGGAFSASDGQLSVMFFPTSYGTVTPTLLARGGADDSSTPTAWPMSADEIYAEQLQAAAFDRSRRDAEAAEYAQRFAEIESRLEQMLQEQESLRGELRRASAPMKEGHALDAGAALNAGAILGHDTAINKE